MPKLPALKGVQDKRYFLIPTVSFTDLDQGRDILSRFSLPKSMKHSVQFVSRMKINVARR